MRMLERRPCGLAVIFENQNVLKAPVLFQIENAITESPENVFDTLGWQRRQTGIVIGSFNDHFMRANAVHLVEHAFGLAVQIAFDAQCRKLIRNYAHCPARTVALRRRAAIRVRAVGLNLRRCFTLVAITKRAEAALDFHSLPDKIGRTLGTVGRDNYPSSDDRVFSKLGH